MGVALVFVARITPGVAFAQAPAPPIAVSPVAPSAPSPGEPVSPAPTSSVPVPPEPAVPPLPAVPPQPAPVSPPGVLPGVAGWNGEHFFIGSSDGQFQLSPFGYLNANYTVYDGDGTPPDAFAIKRARFGFQGFFGKQIDYVLSADVVANGVSVRDAYVQVKPFRELQLRVGQFKEPFSAEVSTVDTNVEFVSRSSVSMLYPSAAGSFRSPGAMLLGNIGDGTVEYWAGVFNGRGILAPPSSNWPDIVGRVRISPLRWTSAPALKHLSIGASFSYSREALIAKDQSFSGLIDDGAYTFTPSFPINGPVQRYGADLMWLFGPLGVRAEYAELHQARDNVGTAIVGGGGYESYPEVVGRGAYAQVSYFVTGETEDENAPPKVRRPFLGPATPGTDGGRGPGAIQVAARFTWLSSSAPGATFATFAPTSVASYSNTTDQITLGVHWYMNYWVLYKVDVNIDQLRQPSVEGFLPQNYVVVIQQLQFRF